MIVLIIVLVVLAALVMWAIGVYNGLVKLRNRVKEAWSDIDVQLKRRYDLIPNLVNAVKGYASHEKDVFENVTKARNMAVQAEQAGDVAGAARAENMLSGALKSLFAVAEAYPDLKANQNFLDLQAQLTDTENKIQAARRFYNGNVRDFNTKQEVFPANLVAGMFGFEAAEFFEVEDEAQRAVPEVDFSSQA
ncbi:MAG: LemA family protein [Candidatus Doudnabacteria bacterium]|nr:LemA family protein [Candidatus Doudnabacteria bacterium]